MRSALIVITFLVTLVAPPASLAVDGKGSAVSDEQMLSRVNTQVFMVSSTVNGKSISRLAAVYDLIAPRQHGETEQPGKTWMVTSPDGLISSDTLRVMYQGKTYVGSVTFVDETLGLAGIIFTGLVLPGAQPGSSLPTTGLDMPVSVITAKNNIDFKVQHTTVKSITAGGFPAGLATSAKIPPTAATDEGWAFLYS